MASWVASTRSARIGHPAVLKPVRQSSAHLSHSAHRERNSEFKSVHTGRCHEIACNQSVSYASEPGERTCQREKRVLVGLIDSDPVGMISFGVEAAAAPPTVLSPSLVSRPCARVLYGRPGIPSPFAGVLLVPG
jgi:hypothetical protein